MPKKNNPKNDNDRQASGTELCTAELCESPLGPIQVAATPGGLLAVGFDDDPQAFNQGLVRLLRRSRGVRDDKPTPAVHYAAAAIQQINEYLLGERRVFDLTIDWSVMTPFQEQALRLTYIIPFGQVTTYGEIARQLDRPNAARAVGRAQATNPMPLVIPCHRVIGSDSSLRGYGGRGGLETKAWLLSLEGVMLPPPGL